MKSTHIVLSVTLCILLGVDSLPFGSTASADTESPLIPGIEQLVRLDRLAEFHRSTFVGSVSSYDRTGGNDDGFGGKYSFVRKEGDAYRKSILQTIEHAPTGNEQVNDYAGTTFLYLEKRPTCDMSLPPQAQRAVVDLKRIVFAAWWNVPISAFSFSHATLTKDVVKLDGQDVRFLSMRCKGGDWFGHHFISFNCELPAAGHYQVSLDVVKGPAVGMVQLFQDEAPVGPAVDMYAPQPEKTQVSLGTLALPEGKNNLLFKITDKNEQSSGLGLDLVNIVCEKKD